MTTEDIMKLAESLADAASECVKSRGSIACTCGTQHSALRAAVDTLVAERDALRTERDTLRQVIEQQLLNAKPGYVMVPVEPTPEMIRAAMLATNKRSTDTWDGYYKAMIAAAPKEPT